MARSRAADKARKFACTCLRMRGQWLACAFRRFASLYLEGASQLASWSARLGHMNVSRERVRLRVIASVSEAIQKACAGIWIASSRSLLAMMRSEGEAVTHGVIAGLDPAIHAKPRLVGICHPSAGLLHVSMDHRVKLGGDAETPGRDAYPPGTRRLAHGPLASKLAGPLKVISPPWGFAVLTRLGYVVDRRNPSTSRPNAA